MEIPPELVLVYLWFRVQQYNLQGVGTMVRVGFIIPPHTLINVQYNTYKSTYLQEEKDVSPQLSL